QQRPRRRARRRLTGPRRRAKPRQRRRQRRARRRPREPRRPGKPPLTEQRKSARAPLKESSPSAKRSRGRARTTRTRVRINRSRTLRDIDQALPGRVLLGRKLHGRATLGFVMSRAFLVLVAVPLASSILVAADRLTDRDLKKLVERIDDGRDR